MRGSYHASPEENLRHPQLILVLSISLALLRVTLAGDCLLKDLEADISNTTRFEVLGVDQHVVTASKLLVCPSCRISGARDLDGLQHTTGLQLTENHGSLELPSFLSLVGLDTTDIMDIGGSNGVHEINKR